jgi:omega-6 fatty acid desaturase (delta-12 desaturase)
VTAATMSEITPTPKEVRAVIAPELRRRSSARGIVYFAVSAAVYWTTFLAMALPATWPARVAIALVNGLAVGILFIVGHDACHGSLTPSHLLNNVIGRLAFLPSLHPFAAWEYSHNAMHHGWTNLRGKDPVYCPLTFEEFQALPRWRQRLERVYRSWPGMLPLYLFTIWWRIEMLPRGRHRKEIDKRGTYERDRLLVLAFPPLQFALLLLVSHSIGVALLGAVVPFLAFNWLMGFATFQHHTHPRVIWYDDEHEWNFFRSQVQGTVHVVFPRWIEVALHNIMEHTAHHVDMKVPLYNLTNAQQRVEEAFGEENVITEPFTFAGMNETFRVCQLYDFAEHRWLSFDGRPTTEPAITQPG